MSTNFYIREASVNTQTGERVFEDSHIGKRSGGWTFMFQGEDTKSVADWKSRMASMPENMTIVDEYDTPYTPNEFWEVVDQTTKPWGPKKIDPKTQRPAAMGDINEAWIDDGFCFYAGEFA